MPENQSFSGIFLIFLGRTKWEHWPGMGWREVQERIFCNLYQANISCHLNMVNCRVLGTRQTFLPVNSTRELVGKIFYFSNSLVISNSFSWQWWTYYPSHWWTCWWCLWWTCLWWPDRCWSWCPRHWWTCWSSY